MVSRPGEAKSLASKQDAPKILTSRLRPMLRGRGQMFGLQAEADTKILESRPGDAKALASEAFVCSFFAGGGPAYSGTQR